MVEGHVDMGKVVDKVESRGYDGSCECGGRSRV